MVYYYYYYYYHYCKLSSLEESCDTQVFLSLNTDDEEDGGTGELPPIEKIGEHIMQSRSSFSSPRLSVGDSTPPDPSLHTVKNGQLNGPKNDMNNQSQGFSIDQVEVE